MSSEMDDWIRAMAGRGGGEWSPFGTPPPVEELPAATDFDGGARGAIKAPPSFSALMQAEWEQRRADRLERAEQIDRDWEYR